MNQNTVTREECEAIIHINRYFGDGRSMSIVRLASAHLELLTVSQKRFEDSMIAHRWFAKHFGEIMNGRDFITKCEMADPMIDELRSQKAALESRCETYAMELGIAKGYSDVLESQLAEANERCEELRIAWKVTKEQLAEARKALVEAGCTLYAVGMEYCHLEKPVPDMCLAANGHVNLAIDAIDAAGALRAKPESDWKPSDPVWPPK